MRPYICYNRRKAEAIFCESKEAAKRTARYLAEQGDDCTVYKAKEIVSYVSEVNTKVHEVFLK